MGVLFLFIDGIGISAASETNPFSTQHWKGLEALSGGIPWFFDTNQQFELQTEEVCVSSIDACLGVEGLPQSGTGQTALFTGKSAPEIAGKHFGPFPHSTCKPLLKHHSLFTDLQACGKRPYFANAYPNRFFEVQRKRPRWSCSTYMSIENNLPLHTVQHVLDGTAVTAEIKQDYWRSQLNENVPEISEKDAARRLLTLSTRYDVVLYEYYLTDKAGHSQSMQNAIEALKRLDTLLLTLVEERPNTTTILLSSDHGNLEDLSIKTHTTHPVPCIIHGITNKKVKAPSSITDIKEIILELV